MNRTEKENIVKSLKEKVESAAGVFLVDYSGLTVSQVNSLRVSFKKAGVEYRVVKNTLMRLVVEGTPFHSLSESIRGMTGVIVASDPVLAAKIAVGYSKDNDKFQLRTAVVESQLLDKASIKELSELPSLPEIRSQMLGLLNSSASALLSQLNVSAQHICGVIQANVDKQSE